LAAAEAREAHREAQQMGQTQYFHLSPQQAEARVEIMAWQEQLGVLLVALVIVFQSIQAERQDKVIQADKAQVALAVAVAAREPVVQMHHRQIMAETEEMELHLLFLVLLLLTLAVAVVAQEQVNRLEVLVVVARALMVMPLLLEQMEEQTLAVAVAAVLVLVVFMVKQVVLVLSLFVMLIPSQRRLLQRVPHQLLCLVAIVSISGLALAPLHSEENHGSLCPT
jgi:hypothetical protein